MRDSRLIHLILLTACALGLGGGPAQARDTGAIPPPPLAVDFPVPESLRPAVAFWKRVYLEVTTDAGLLHDSRRLDLVYGVVHFAPEMSKRARDRKVRAEKKAWRSILNRLAGGGEPRDIREKTVLLRFEAALGREPRPRDLRVVGRRIRFQLGQRDKFRDGLIRSGAYENEMRAVFRDRELPEDLAYLPHVESSFNLKAYSKYGAAGIWQFIRSTGRRFMKVDYVIDERLDPMMATSAAARLLSENYESLGTWPLAITAYNHGRAGMRRAARVLGTQDIGVIVAKYRSRRFGFASRNFYAQFLAARAILRSYESYFGPVERWEPEPVDEVTLPFYADVDVLQEHLQLSPEVLRRYNPALRPPVFRARKRIPKGFTLRLPAGTVGADAEHWLAGIPSELRAKRQTRSAYYHVRRGDALSTIAQRHGTSVGAIVALNNLPSRHRIYVGQVLSLPGSGSVPSRSLVRQAYARVRPAAHEITPVSSPPPPLPENSPWRRIDDGVIIVDADETIGHFAEWLAVPTERLRRKNRVRAGRHIRIGQTLELDFSKVSEETFLQRRIEFHKGIEEDFFGSFRVAGTVTHRLRRGESLWTLAHKTYGVPVWLIHRYNPDVDLSEFKPGIELRIPIAEKGS